jgi:glucosamine--fructose-6-phosphate aminotransferase (isomerizing)
MRGRGTRGRPAADADALVTARAIPTTAEAEARLSAARLAPYGPDEMGREIAGGPDAVEGAIAEVMRSRKAIAQLREGTRRTVLVGTGASLAVARTAAPSWRRAQRGSQLRSADGGVRPVLVRESSAIVFGGADGEILDPGDLVVAISQSGGSPETLTAARLAVSAGCRVVGVTADAGSPLVEAATLALVTPSGHEEGAATKSALSTLAVLLAIPGALGTDRSARSELAGRLRDIVRDWLEAARFGARLAAAERTWIIGLGTADGLATAAGLLWHEKVHRLVFPASVSEFRHGPVEAAGADDAVLLIDVDEPLPGRTAYLDLLRRELAALGPTVVEVSAGAGVGEAPGGATLPVSGSTAVAAVEALLRVQQLARATAVAAGTYRDGFDVLRGIVTAAPLG